MKFLLLPLIAALALPFEAYADHQYPPKDFKDLDDLSLALTIMEVGLARCNIAKGSVSPKRASKILHKSLRKRIGSFEYDYHMSYLKANNYAFANEYALLSAKNNCNKPDEHNFRKFYNKLAEFFN